MFLGKYAGAQNLVPNPSFEDYDTCPDFVPQLTRANHWFYVSDGTSDYFNACSTAPFNVSVPSNFVGYQTAHTGNGYAGCGFIVSDSLYLGSHFPGAEYLGVRLQEPMQNRLYKVSFYVSLADSIGNTPSGTKIASQSLNIFNCAFTPNQIYEAGVTMMSIEPDMEVEFVPPLTDSLGWTKVEGYVYGSEGDEYLIIGQLNKDYQRYVSHYYDYFSGFRQIATYYYYDDVEVVPISEGDFPNIFTPNGDGLNDEFDLRINCNNCSFQLQIFNRWGQELFNEDAVKWDGKYNDKLCDDGIYYYIFNDLVNKKSIHSGFFQLLKN